MNNYMYGGSERDDGMFVCHNVSSIKFEWSSQQEIVEYTSDNNNDNEIQCNIFIHLSMFVQEIVEYVLVK